MTIWQPSHRVLIELWTFIPRSLISTRESSFRHGRRAAVDPRKALDLGASDRSVDGRERKDRFGTKESDEARNRENDMAGGSSLREGRP